MWTPGTDRNERNYCREQRLSYLDQHQRSSTSKRKLYFVHLTMAAVQYLCPHSLQRVQIFRGNWSLQRVFVVTELFNIVSGGSRGALCFQFFKFSHSFRQKLCQIRKHSSRMRTACFSDSGEGGFCPTPPWGRPRGLLTPGCRPARCKPPGGDPPVNRMTEASENITLPKTSFTGGNIRLVPPGLSPPSGKSWIRYCLLLMREISFTQRNLLGITKYSF